MPTLEVLDTLQGILEKLVRLSGVERGDPLRASDWNTMVDCIRLIAKTLLDREVSGTVVDHDHPDQVSLEWLDPNLKRLMEKGPLHEPEALARLSKLERELKRLRSSGDKQTDQLSHMRSTVYDMGTAKVGQEGRLKNLELRIKNLPDARQDVFTLNEKVSSLGSKIDQTLAFEDRLNVNGEPIDLADIKDEVEKLRTLRQGLTEPDGNLWDATTIRRELAQLQSSLLTQEDLELALERLETGGPTLDPQMEGLIDARVKTRVDERLQNITTGDPTDPTINTRLKALEESQAIQKSSLEQVTDRLDTAPNQDEFQGLQRRIKDAETDLTTTTNSHNLLMNSFSEITGFLQDFSKPSTPGAPAPTLDLNSLRFNVAINNNEELREKLQARQVFSVEQIARMSSSTWDEMLGSLVSRSEATLIRRNIKTLANPR